MGKDGVSVKTKEANLRLAKLKLDTMQASPDESGLAEPSDDEIAITAVDVEQAGYGFKTYVWYNQPDNI